MSPHVEVPLLPSIGKPALPVFWAESFERMDPERWRSVEVRGGHTDYAVTDLDGRRCLKADSRNSASILLAAIRFNPKHYEWLSWEWRVDRLVEGEALDRKDGSDAAARVYVYFDTPGLPWQRRNLDYVWSASLPVGTVMNSAFSSSSKILVAENGSTSLGQWRKVTRNLQDDYRRCFGKKGAPDVVAIGVMTDTDNTHTQALAYFDELQVSRRPRLGGSSAAE